MHSVIVVPPARVGPGAPLRVVDQPVEHLRTVWPTDTRSAAHRNISCCLAVELSLRPGADPADPGQRVNSEKWSLVALAMPFDLVREDDLVVLTAAPSEVAG